MLESIIMSHQWLLQEQGLCRGYQIHVDYQVSGQMVSGQIAMRRSQLSIMQKMEKITLEKKGGTFTQIVTIYYINPSLSLSESLSPTTRSKKKRKYKRNEMKNSYLYYIKTQKPYPKIKNYPRLGPLQGFLQTQEASGRRDGATRRKSTRGSTPLPRKRGNTRDLGPWFLSVGPRWFQLLPGISRFW